MKRLSILLLAASALAAEKPIEVTLEFSRPLMQIQAGDGGSVCQFHGSDPVKGTIAADRAYSTLGGFPDDNSSTEFGKFCDVAFSTRGQQGMGLSQVWSTPCIFQTPPGSVGKRYALESWNKLDFSMYESGLLAPERYTAKAVKAPRGHTVPMLMAALTRARRENQRILIWNDLHTDYPQWMWQNRQRSQPIPESYWEEAALHVVYYAKYLTARHGIPVHTVSFQNEPDLPGRHAFTPEMLIRISRILREKLDEAGLQGVRIMPYTSVGLGDVRLDWRNVTVRTLTQTYDLLEGPYAQYQKYIDSLGGHLSQTEPPVQRKLPNTQFWRASGDADNHYKGHGSVSFDMGPDDQIDEVIRLNTWLYGKGVSLAGIWQVALRMGHTIDNFVLPEKFDIEKTFRHAAIDGAAVVYPYVRPGMFLVGGSQVREARADYSVDGFGGRGKNETVVISNSREPRSFRIRFQGVTAVQVEVFQASSISRERSLGRKLLKNGVLELTVPGDSVTSLVAASATTRPMIIMVAKSARHLTAKERQITSMLSHSYDVSVVSESLTGEEQDRFASKRHPVDPMGAACYLLSDTIDGRSVAYAYRAVMAPVIALGEVSRKILGIKAGANVLAGKPLSFRDELDPPPQMLEGGLPIACGQRIHWEARDGTDGLALLVRRALQKAE